MPNWCDNQVTITGPNKIIDKIEKIVKEEKDSGGLLDFFHPMPEGLRDTTADGSDNKELIKKYGYSDWYGWACDNWSTKWDISEFYGVDRQYLTEQSEGESTISFAFSSAWSPPTGAYENFLAENEECSLKAYYYEGGCDFMGIWDNGDDRCYTVSETAPDGSKDEFWDTEDGEMLDEMFGITESMADWEAEQEAEKEDVTEYVKGKAMNIGEEA
jgi:hypothetical protein